MVTVGFGLGVVVTVALPVFVKMGSTVDGGRGGRGGVVVVAVLVVVVV